MFLHQYFQVHEPGVPEELVQSKKVVSFWVSFVAVTSVTKAVQIGSLLVTQRIKGNRKRCKLPKVTLVTEVSGRFEL